MYRTRSSSPSAWSCPRGCIIPARKRIDSANRFAKGSLEPGREQRLSKCDLLCCRVRTSVSRGTDDFPAQLHERRRQKRLGGQFFGLAGIGGASRPLPEREQERPRLSATRLRRPRPKWP